MFSLAPQTAGGSLAAARTSPAPATRARDSFHVVAVRTEAELASYRELWDDLARNAVEPNVFYESWMVAPALRAFLGTARLQIVLVLKTVPERAEPLLCGLFPVEERWGYKGLPGRYLSLWQHPYSFLAVPLIRTSCARECLNAFLDWIAHDRQGASLLELSAVTADGPFYHLLLEVNRARSAFWYIEEEYTRGILRPRKNAEEYLGIILSSRERKELRRKEKRLGELGGVEYRSVQAGEDLEPWIEAFLRMEASGWKGRCGTAMASRPEDRDFFATIVREAFRRRQLWMLGLFLNDQCIALKCSFISGQGSFAFKIAFDEQLARVSPGYQLELQAIRDLHHSLDLQWLDSCTSMDQSMFDRLYLDRRVIATILLSTGTASGDLAVSVLPILRWLKRRLGWRKHPTSAAADSRSLSEGGEEEHLPGPHTGPASSAAQAPRLPSSQLPR